MDSDDRVMGGMFLGLVMFGFFVWMVSRVVASVFHDLSIMFDAIGTAAMSFLGMAWAIVQLAGILAVGAALIYAAYWYYQLVKEATEVLDTVDARCVNLSRELQASQKEMEERLNQKVEQLRRELAAALAKPSVGPEPALPAPAHKIEVIEVIRNNESATTPRVSNPY